MTQLQSIPVGELRESPLNPRQRYDQAALKELAESLKASGQLEALLVRRNNGHFEIAAGHRRYRAAKLVGLTHLEAKVQDLDDATFIEILNISNLQRDDLHPLEEAQGFRDLMERAGYDVAKIAARVGRSEKYVYDRIKLLQLTPEAKKLFLAGEFEAGHAILLARLSPTDQKRAIGKPARGQYNDGGGGLFEFEDVDSHPDEPSLKLDDKQKPRSVRELAKWIDDNVRFQPAALDPFLFPVTAHNLTEAQDADLKVVHITHDYRVPDGARDEKQRTYGEQAWKHAGGKKGKECDYAVLGVVVAGPGRGESFMVCVRKDKCKAHWAKEQKDLERDRKARAKSSGGASSRDTSYERREEKYELERKAREAEHARWKAALPQLYAALAEKIKAEPVTPASRVGRYLLETAKGWISKGGAAHSTPGRSLDDLVRHLVFASIDADAFQHWGAEQDITRALKAWGLDARKIVDEASPKPVKEPAKKPAKKARAK
jgi:ParB/RepB/Spo0J family partition protein